MKLPLPPLRHKLLRESLIFFGFVVVTAIITWPWIVQLRDSVPDYGDPYSISYFIWWDYHQTFHDPLNLFHATMFYPYRYTLAFGEYDYGVSLLFFPLFALGVRPLTIYGVAAFLSFPFTGYGMFRLARTLSGSELVGWIAGIFLAFVPFRFNHLSHLHLIFAGWIPLLFEALILCARNRSWRSAAWLGFAFLMNGLTCTTWMILTVIPLTGSGVVLISRNRLWFQRTFWIRASVCLGIATLLLVPFLIPYGRVAVANRFGRSVNEVLEYSATPINWLAAEPRNKLWNGFGVAGIRTEMVLFPGLIAPLLALGALLLSNGRRSDQTPANNRLWLILRCLDFLALVCGIVALLAVGYDGFRLAPFGYTLLSASDPSKALFFLSLLLLIRFSLSYPGFIRNRPPVEENLRESLANPERSELLIYGLIWLVIGVAGSFGLNFFFHRFLYESVLGFQAMRVAVRWAMIAYVGLALLAGLGALKVVSSFSSQRPKWLRSAVLAVIVLALVFELNVAPLQLVRGHVDPDTLTLFLKSRKPKGGIVELPAGERNHFYMLRAIDHGHPLVNANDSFMSPLAIELEVVTRVQPNAERLVEILEQTPVSYVTVRYGWLNPEHRLRLEKLLAQIVAEGKLRFIASFPSAISPEPDKRDDLYAVTKVEPEARTLDMSQLPEFLSLTASSVALPRNLDPNAFSFYRMYRLSYGRRPTYDEFTSFLKSMPAEIVQSGAAEISSSYAQEWANQQQFKASFDKLSDEQYLSTLLQNADVSGMPTELVRGSKDTRSWRAEVLKELANNKEFIRHEVNPAFVVTHYFLYLHRDPDEGGFKFWLERLDKAVDYKGVNEAFANSPERK